MTDLKRVAVEVVREARKEPVIGVEVLVVHSEQRDWRSDRPSPTRSEAGTSTVRVFLDGGRSAEVAREGLDPAVGVAAFHEAAALAAAAPPDPSAALAPRLDVPSRGLGICDPRQSILTDEDRQEALTWNVEACREVGAGVLPGLFVYRERVEQRAFASSRGVEALEKSTRFGLSGSASAAEAPEHLARAENASRNFADVASRPLGTDLGRMVLSMSRTASLPRSPSPILLSPVVVSQLLPEIMQVFRRETVEDTFLARHLNTALGVERLHVIDDASIPGALATRAFDDRGIPPVPVPLLREGVASGLFQGVGAARRRDQRPTGHETQGGGLWLGNLIVRPGGRSRNMIFPELGQFVLAEELVEPVVFDVKTGALRLRVRGFLAAAGAQSSAGQLGHIGVLTLETTVPELFRSIRELASDHERHGIVDTPSWVLSGPWFTVA